MLQQNPAVKEPPWIDVFEVSHGPEGGVKDPTGLIRLAQIGRKNFALGSTVHFVGETGLKGKVSDATIARIRTVTPAELPVTDLASVPVPLRWFVETYGAHTPAALIHDHLIGNPGRPDDMTDVYADRYFRFMLKAVGVSWLRRSLMWAAVALRTRFVASWTNKAQVALWVLLSVAGMVAAALAVAWWSWPLALVAVLLPFPAALLWGRQYGAGLVAVAAAPWLLPPSILAAVGYAIYWLLERIAGLFGLGGLEFRIVQSDPVEPRQ